MNAQINTSAQAAALAPPASLRRRLAVGITLCVTLLWLIATVISARHLSGEIDEVSDSALQEVVQRILPLAYMEVLNRDSADQTADVIAPVGPHREYITYVVRRADGQVLLHSHDAEPERFPLPPQPGFQGGSDNRFYTETAARGAIFVTAGERPGHRAAAIRHAVLTLLWPLMLLLPMVLFATLALVKRSFQPVTDLGKAIEARGGGNLSPVEDHALPLELRPVAGSVNALLERLRRAMEAERSFTANSAHELRTPIAGALAQTQRLIAEIDAEGPRQRARDIETALRRLARLSEKLLQLAKAEGGALLCATPQDLAPILDMVLRDFGEEQGRLNAEIAPRFFSPMDPDAFGILARNLIENALRHGRAGAGIEVLLQDDGLFMVRNGGEILSEAQRASLFRRFARGDSGAAGTGLGLSIAAAIARGVHAPIEILSPAPGHADGVAVRVVLPRAAAPDEDA